MTKPILRSRQFQNLLCLAVMAALFLAVMANPCLTAQTAPDIAGTWQGTLPSGKGVRIILKITKGENSALHAIFYSIDSAAGSGGRSVTSISLVGSTVQFAVATIDGRFEGKLRPDGGAIAGTWTQGLQPLPLTLARVDSSGPKLTRSHAGPNGPPDKEQLGLKLEPVRAPAGVFVIDHVEPPSEN